MIKDDGNNGENKTNGSYLKDLNKVCSLGNCVTFLIGVESVKVENHKKQSLIRRWIEIV